MGIMFYAIMGAGRAPIIKEEILKTTTVLVSAPVTWSWLVGITTFF